MKTRLFSILVAGFLFLAFTVHPARAQGFEPNFDEGMAAFNYGDNELALRHFLRLSNDGDQRAQYYLAYMMDSGLGMGKDVYGAASWYIKSASQNYLPAMVYVGYIYSAGHGVTVDKKKAFDWYTKAAQMGDPVAQNNLAVMLREGDPYAIDKKLAAQWFLQSAMQGNMRAQYNLANMYRLADGIGKNSAEAMKWYTYAANQGDMYAQYALGYMYFTTSKDLASKVDAAKEDLAEAQKEKAAQKPGDKPKDSQLVPPAPGDKPKDGAPVIAQPTVDDRIAAAQQIIDANTPEIETDKQQALEWFRRSAEQGLTGAQMALARMYENGDAGPDKGIGDAFVWYMNGAEAGNPAAMRRVGMMYEGKVRDWNDKSIELNYKLAFKWLRKAAEDKDDKLAMVEIGQMYSEGHPESGITRDPDKAVKWFQHAAETGDPTAQMLLAMAYETGTGIPRDARAAYKWYSLAVRAYRNVNDPEGLATAVKRRIGVQLDPAEKGSVDQEVENWRPVVHTALPTKKERPLFYDDQ